MSAELPAVPNLEQLRKQAKDLLTALERSDSAALSLLGQHHPAAKSGRLDRAPRLADAQVVVARRYGLASWPKLREEVALRLLSFEARANRFVRMAANPAPGALNECWRIANLLLDREPAIATTSVYSALVLGNVEAVQRQLAADPTWATATSGPGMGRPPLLWATFSRLHRRDQTISAGLLRCARLLLDAGADVNAVCPLDDPGNTAVLRPLYGACGVADFPEMAELLIARGALLEDGESLYHSNEARDTRCLELLLRHGANPSGANVLAHALDRDGTRRIELLLDAGADPNATLDGHPLLQRAISIGRGVEVVELLLRHGADPRARGPDGATAAAVALRHGATAIADRLAAAGADRPVGPFERFVERCAAGEVTSAKELAESSTLYLTMGRGEIEAFLQLAGRRDTGIAEAMVQAGFPVSVTNHQGQTALHWAAWNGRAAMVRTLLANGAEVEAREREFGGTPLGWAAHGASNAATDEGCDHLEVVRLLLEAGADPNTKNAWGEAMIGELDDSAVADLLRAAGCVEDQAG